MAKRRSLVDVLDDPALFASLYPSPSWDCWRVFCRALVGAPIVGADLDLYRRCTGRVDPPTTPASEAWVVSGRRSGKSRVAAAVGAYLAAFADVRRLARGETGVVMLTAVDKAQARVLFSYLRALFELPALAPLVVEQTADSLTLRHRVRVEVRASSFRSVRGVTLLAAVLDEVAFLRDEASALPDVELYRALKPALATTGGLILGISSPWARSGLLWQKYHRHFGHDGPVLVWQSATTVMNPDLDATLIDEATDDDPEAAASEWSGCFRSDLESYCSLAVLDAVTTPGVVERPPVAAATYCAFLDVAAGTGRDSFALAIAHAVAHDDTTTGVLDVVREWVPPFDPLAVTREAAVLIRSYRAAARSDAYAGGWVVEAFRRFGVEVEQSAEPKSVLYASFLPSLTARKVDLLDMPKLRSQLAALERRRRAGGRDVIDHRPAGTTT